MPLVLFYKLYNPMPISCSFLSQSLAVALCMSQIYFCYLNKQQQSLPAISFVVELLKLWQLSKLILILPLMYMYFYSIYHRSE